MAVEPRGGPEWPINDLFQAGLKAFEEHPEQVRAALEAGGTLIEMCDRLGHARETPSAQLAARLTEALSTAEQQDIVAAVLDALEREKFPFECGHKDSDLVPVQRVRATPQNRNGKTVIVIEK